MTQVVMSQEMSITITVTTETERKDTMSSVNDYARDIIDLLSLHWWLVLTEERTNAI